MFSFSNRDACIKSDVIERFRRSRDPSASWDEWTFAWFVSWSWMHFSMFL